MRKPVVQELCKLCRFRNEYDVFDGEMEIEDTEDFLLKIRWKREDKEAVLTANVRESYFTVLYKEKDEYLAL